MARWDDWDYGEPENRGEAVKRHLARFGIGPDPKHPPAPPPPTSTAEPTPKWLDRRDGLPGDAEALARRLGYAVVEPGPIKSSLPPDTAAELRSLEEAARRYEAGDGPSRDD